MLFFKRKKKSVEKKNYKYGVTIDNLIGLEYQDKKDEEYLNKLKLNETFDKLMKQAVDLGIDRMNMISVMGSYVKVTKENQPHLFECVKEGCRILCIEKMPDIYICDDPYLNAYVTGIKNPILVIHNSLLKRMNHDEMMFVIGHELGHIKSEHMEYHMVGELIVNMIIEGTSYIPAVGNLVSDIVTKALEVLYYDWYRKSEITADHAGLLVSQNLKSSISALAKLGGYPKDELSDIEICEYLNQAESFESLDENMYNKFLKIYASVNRTHPWTVLRSKELLNWVESNEYVRVIRRSSIHLLDSINEIKNMIESKKKKISEVNDKRGIFLNKEKIIKQLNDEIGELTIKLNKYEEIYKEPNMDEVSKATGKILKDLKTPIKDSIN